MEQDRDAPWARATSILQSVFERQGRASIGPVEKIGEGPSHEVFAAFVDVDPDPEGRSGPYTVSLPRETKESASGAYGPAAYSRLEREGAFLAAVAEQTEAIRVPALVAVVPTEGGYAAVRSYVQGIPLDLRVGRQPAVPPWQVVAEVAAAIHGVDLTRVPDNNGGSARTSRATPPYPPNDEGSTRTSRATPPYPPTAGIDKLEGYKTRRAHSLSALTVFRGQPELEKAEKWAFGHLPPDGDTVLLHGDLGGQSILLHPGEPPRVVGWERAMRGDPAYDLAAVTYCSRHPFKATRGFERLLEAYAASGGKRITAAAVRFYELCLAGRLYREVRAGGGDSRAAYQAVTWVANALARARACYSEAIVAENSGL